MQSVKLIFDINVNVILIVESIFFYKPTSPLGLAVIASLLS